MNDNDIVEEINKKLHGYYILLSIPLVLLFLLNWFFCIINCNTWIIYVQYKLMFFECIITYLITLFYYGIFRSTKKAIISLMITFLLISFFNQLKMFYTEQPLLISDFKYITQFGEIISFVKTDLISNLVIILLFLMMQTILSLIIIGIFWKKIPIIDSKNIIVRIACIAIPIIIFIIFFAPISVLNDFFQVEVYNTEKIKNYYNYTSIKDYYFFNGILGGMYGQFLENEIKKPEDYDENIISNELSNVKENDNKILGKPNIIVVFSESFWDIEQLSEIKFNKNVTPNFNRLKNNGLFINMISPVYGGTSANVEFEFLTGANLMFFNQNYVPYMHLYQNDKSYEKPSIITQLKNNGYYTKIVSCSSPNLFECKNAYKYFGVDQIEYLLDMPDEVLKGNEVSDEYLTSKIIDTLKNKDKNEKLFYMTLTLQNHMPYTKDKYDKYDVWIENSNLLPEYNEVISSYAQGIYDADKQLGRLYNYIQSFDEPTILVFYGDHLPYLSYKSKNIIDYIDYFNTDDELLNAYRLYNTQALVLANFELPKNNENLYLSPDLLSAYILNNMDINVSNYYKWIYNSRKIIGASNNIIAVDSKGKLFYTKDLEDEYKRIYNLRRMIEYKLFVK